MCKSYLYTDKNDNRQRMVYKDEFGELHTKSYPRYLMEQKLGRPLEPNEDVHHKDGDVTNNNLDNLEIKIHGQHQKEHSTKYFDKIMICEECQNEFLWTAIKQRNYYSNLSRTKNPRKGHIFCSKRCAGVFGRKEQLGRNAQSECE